MRYYFDKLTRKLVTVRPRRSRMGPNIIPDIEPCRNIVEGGMITSRSEIREIEHRHGVRQIGNDWVGERPPELDRH